MARGHDRAESVPNSEVEIDDVTGGTLRSISPAASH
jgi:hypothetical protein